MKNPTNVQEKTSSFQKLKRLMTRKERRAVYSLMVLSLVTAVIQSTGVISLMPFIGIVMNFDTVRQNQWLSRLYTRMAFPSDQDFIVFLGFAVMFLLVVSSLLSSVTNWTKERFVLNQNYRMSCRLLTVYLNRPYEYFLLNNSAALGKSILGDIGTLGNSFISQLIELFINSAMFVTLLLTLMVVNVKITLIVTLIFGVIYGGLTVLIRGRLLKNGRLVNQFNRQRYKTANEALNSIKITKASGLEGYFLERFMKAARKFTNYQSFARLVADVPSVLIEGFVYSGIILTIIFLILRGYDINALIPTIAIFAMAGVRMLPALGKLFKAATTIYHNQPILDKVYEDMFADSNDYTLPVAGRAAFASHKVEPLPFDDKIELIDAEFSYQGSETIIDHLSLTIHKQSIVGFAGTTGAGKTTLIDIFLGLLSPQHGVFSVDGVVMNAQNLPRWRQSVGYVPQDIFLIDDTITRNIAFGVTDSQIDLNKVRQVAKIAAIDDFIMEQLPEHYETVVGERGVRLSGGQRQRIGLARALYRSPEVLILDEATSALDGTTEEQVLRGIHEQSSVKTMLIIAHRLNTLKVCDTIYLLDQGHIETNGSYDELMRSSERFMKMARKEASTQ